MEQNDAPHPDYIKSFNDGYLMQKHLPELTETIAKSLPESEKGNGFKDGGRQYILDNEKKLPKFLRKDRLTSLNEKSEVSKDKDKNTFERE